MKITIDTERLSDYSQKELENLSRIEHLSGVDYTLEKLVHDILNDALQKRYFNDRTAPF